VQRKCQTGVEGEVENLAMEAVEGVVGGFGPEEEGQQNVADLYCRDQYDGPLDPDIVLDHIYLGQDEAQKMLHALTQIEDAVVQEEAHAARLRHEDPAQDEARQREGAIEQEEQFMSTLGSQLFLLLKTRSPHYRL